MPQMAPLSWLTLFFYFTVIFLIFNSINFYAFMYQSKKVKTFKKKINTNWKW